MTNSPRQIIRSLLLAGGILLALVSGNNIVESYQRYEFRMGIWQPRQQEVMGNLAKSTMMAGEWSNDEPQLKAQALNLLQSDESDLREAQDNIQQEKTKLFQRKLGWGTGCGVGVIMAVSGLVLRRREKPNRAIQSKEAGLGKAAPSTNEKNCPFCAETIKRDAIKCRFCGADLPRQSTSQPKPVSPPKLPPAIPPKAPPVDPFIKPVIPRFLSLEGGTIHFECGYCSQRIEIDAAGGGMEIKCPECGEPQKVPTS